MVSLLLYIEYRKSIGHTTYSKKSGPSKAKIFHDVDLVTGIALDKVVRGVQLKAMPIAKQNHFKNFSNLQMAEVEILNAACQMEINMNNCKNCLGNFNVEDPPALCSSGLSTSDS